VLTTQADDPLDSAYVPTGGAQIQAITTAGVTGLAPAPLPERDGPAQSGGHLRKHSRPQADLSARNSYPESALRPWNDHQGCHSERPVSSR
jgi:hypothetical protein